MKVHPLTSLIVAIVMLFGFGPVALAQTATPTVTPEVTPNVEVEGIGIVDGTVTIAQAAVTGPGWVVIHADTDGAPGPVLGYAPLVAGENLDVVVTIDEDAATPFLHAMLHVDAGVVGTLEFPGPDGPVTVEGAVVTARFSSTPVVEEEESVTSATMRATVPTTMPTTGASPSILLIFAVMAAVVLALGGSVVVSRRRHI